MISAVALQISCVAALLAVAVLAIALSRTESATAVVYSATLAICVIGLFGTIRWLLGNTANVSGLILPVGLPWLGAHFRLDALASFSLSSSTWAGPRQAFMPSATATTTRRRTACSPSMRPFWPA